MHMGIIQLCTNPSLQPAGSYCITGIWRHTKCELCVPPYSLSAHSSAVCMYPYSYTLRLMYYVKWDPRINLACCSQGRQLYFHVLSETHDINMSILFKFSFYKMFVLRKMYYIEQWTWPLSLHLLTYNVFPSKSLSLLMWKAISYSTIHFFSFHSSTMSQERRSAEYASEQTTHTTALPEPHQNGTDISTKHNVFSDMRDKFMNQLSKLPSKTMSWVNFSARESDC